jgi:hypothetical protein
LLILVHTAHAQAVGHAGPGFGRLLSPRQYSRAADTAHAGIPWAADNDCFQRLDAKAYRAMLDTIDGLPGCLFVTAPDVVADPEATIAYYLHWEELLLDLGQPIAYVAQDGQRASVVPWDQIGCLFIGGTTGYKLSAEAERLGREAKERGLWLHMGRVNSRRRFHYAQAIGCDSVDGTQFSMFRNRWLPHGLRWAAEPYQGRFEL